MLRYFYLLTMCFFSSNALSGYYVVGPIKAEDCYDFGIKYCSTKTVTEVRKDGKRYEVATYFEDVSDYSESKKLCSINTKSRGMGVLSYGVNALVQPDFWGVDKNGKLEKIDADRIYFNCIKK